MVTRWGFGLVLLFNGLVLVTASVSQASLRSELAFIIQATGTERQAEQEISELTLHEVSETKLVGMVLIRLYKLFISTQDVPACIFKLTCSRFGMKAVQQYGLLHGILMTSDRLQRCNRMAEGYYVVVPETGQALDHPVEAYYLGDRSGSKE